MVFSLFSLLALSRSLSAKKKNSSHTEDDDNDTSTNTRERAEGDNSYDQAAGYARHSCWHALLAADMLYNSYD
jgi:hypothetical protein